MVKNLPANAGDSGSVPGEGRPPGRENGNPLQYSCLEIPWTEEPGGLQSLWSQRVGHDRVTVISVPDFLIVKTDMWVTAQGNECWELAGRKCEGTEWGIH